MRRYSFPGHARSPGPTVLPASPGALWGFVATLCVLFFIAYWPSGARPPGGGAAVNGVPPGAALQQQPPQQQKQQQPSSAVPAAADPGHGGGGSTRAPKDKVLLELFVMSQCPDASYCESVFDKVLAKTHGFTHVQTRYIQYSESGGAVTCPHGDEECAGNLNQLCVQAHVPADRNYDWFFKFLLCTWDSGSSVGSKEVVRECLSKVGAAGSVQVGAEHCITGAEGKQLMADGATLIKRRGLTRSCTVAIEGEKHCVRDGGRWYGCPPGATAGEAQFVAALCEAYKRKAGRDADADACKPPGGGGEGGSGGGAAAPAAG